MEEDMKEVLRGIRRASRTSATMLYNNRGAYVLMLRREDQKDKPVLQAYLNMLPEVVAEMRAVADEADKHLKTDAMTPNEFVDLCQRAQLAFTKSATMAKEVLGAIRH
jgi:predicted glycosyltransferase